MNRFAETMYGLAAIMLIVALSACSPTLAAQSVAPPGRSARLDEINGFWGTKGYRIELSRGVALAVTCYRAGPCDKLRVTSDDPAIAEVRTASLGTLQPNGWNGNQATSAALVVVGKTPGTTHVHVHSAAGGRDIRVTVVPQPVVNPQTAVAR